MGGDRIDKLGVYYIYFNIGVRYGLIFEEFVKKVDDGTWSDMVGVTNEGSTEGQLR